MSDFRTPRFCWNEPARNLAMRGSVGAPKLGLPLNRGTAGQIGITCRQSGKPCPWVMPEKVCGSDGGVGSLQRPGHADALQPGLLDLLCPLNQPLGAAKRSVIAGFDALDLA